MDTKELRIGNIVRRKYSDDIQAIRTITKDDSYNGGYYIQLCNGDKCCIDYIEPIPLTEGLLLKCGSNVEYYEFQIKEQRLLTIEDFWILYNTRTNFYGVMLYNRIFKQIEYLHQLQNIYFDLVGIELKVKP